MFEPKRIEALKDVRIKMVGSGQEAAHVVVVDETGQAWSWGNNEFGQLGQGDNMHRLRVSPSVGDIGNDSMLTSGGSRLQCLGLDQEVTLLWRSASASATPSSSPVGGTSSHVETTPMVSAPRGR